ncbi:MAG TPA: glycoside hydrolase family 75 protein [Chthoniobacterales bacterium]|nr:glycoside hydrolase family 75 protein [Chthoniobacterales bacterium]
MRPDRPHLQIELLVLWASLTLMGCPGPRFSNLNPETPTPSPTPTSTPTPPPTPLPETYVPYSHKDVSKLFNGMEIHSRVDTNSGASAWVERKAPDSYVLDLEVRVRVPQAAQTIDQIAQPDGQLPTLLPGLASLLSTSKVSNFYYGLYQLKLDSLNRTLSRLDQLLSRHNFYDCNTILELTDPKTSRKALLIQSDMDVNADGSDADRSSDVNGSSTNFQPYTSYRWPKRSDKPNQFIPEREQKLKQAEAEFDQKTTPPDRKKVLKEQIDELNREIADLKKFSFLISKADPFIVLPGFMLRQASHPFLPKFGDYVVVIHGGKLYPAILGDAGPSYKVGEASLRLATQIDIKANAYNRPSSDLNITYLVFPGSAEAQPGPPDLFRMHDRCAELLNEMGGYAGELWQWENILATPTPSLSASPSPTLTASSPTTSARPKAPGTASSPSPSATASTVPTASPSPTVSPSSPSASPKGAAHRVPRKRSDKEKPSRGD